MAPLVLIIGVTSLLQVCNGQLNNAPNISIAKQNSLQETNKAKLENTLGNPNFLGSNFGLNYIPQNKLLMLQSSNGVPSKYSDLFSQMSKPKNFQNMMYSSIPNQESLTQPSNLQSQPNTQQPSKSEFQESELAFLNSLQTANQNFKQVSLVTDPVPNSQILATPNINYQQTPQNLPPAIPYFQSLVSPSATITTSLPSFMPKSLTSAGFVQNKQSNVLESKVENPQKIFFRLLEPSKPITNPNSMTNAYVPNNKTHGQKSLNLKTILPLILNLMNDKNEGCHHCSKCNCCKNNHNLIQAPHIDTGYSRQRKYGFFSVETIEDDSEELNHSLERRKETKFNRYFQKNNELYEVDDYESESEED